MLNRDHLVRRKLKRSSRVEKLASTINAGGQSSNSDTGYSTQAGCLIQHMLITRRLLAPKENREAHIILRPKFNTLDVRHIFCKTKQVIQTRKVALQLKIIIYSD
jgi:hypothetical protein